jgi:hypothetical protein
VISKHHCKREGFYFESESSSEEDQELSTAQDPNNESQQVSNTEKIEEPEPEPNPEPREETKPEMSDREISAAESKSRPKWPAPYMYTGDGKDRDPQHIKAWF